MTIKTDNGYITILNGQDLKETPQEIHQKGLKEAKEVSYKHLKEKDSYYDN